MAPSTSSTLRSRSRRDDQHSTSLFPASSSHSYPRDSHLPPPSQSSSYPSPHPSLPSHSSHLRAAEARRTPSASAQSYVSAARSQRSHRSRRTVGEGGEETASESGMSAFSAFAGEEERRERRRARKEARRRAREQEETKDREEEKGRDRTAQRVDPTDSPLRRGVRWVTDQPPLRSWSVVLALGVVVLVKWAVGMGGYSGYATPPLRGDLEAQRHWLALTSASLNGLSHVPYLPFLKLYTPPYPSSNLTLPPSEWYFYSPVLTTPTGETKPYWSLDYPPLTAYHSFLLGFLARLSPTTASYVTLRPSLEAEGQQKMDDWEAEMGRLEREGGMKNWMRASVVLGDLGVWGSAVIGFCGWNYGSGGGGGGRREAEEGKARRRMLVAALTILLHPALILIDNGHFQYNSLSLALTLHALNALQRGQDLVGSVAFVLSLGFKQMSLYYAPAVFAYLLGKCVWLGGRRGFTHLIHIGLTVLLTFTLLLLPLLLSSTSSSLFPLRTTLQTLTQLLSRIFPFSRGLFEDKVANVWCALNVVLKLRTVASIPTLARLALGVTGVAVLPVVGGTVWLSLVLSRRRKQGAPEGAEGRAATTAVLLPHLLFLSSLAFFLFSFQVHEKSILLPLMPLVGLMGARECGYGKKDWEWGMLVGNVGIYSMYPLLYRDGVALQYLVLTLFYNYLLGYNPFLLRRGSFIKLLSLVTYALIALLHALELLVTPPPHLPDLFTVANVSLSCGVFGVAWLWGLRRAVEEGWALL